VTIRNGIRTMTVAEAALTLGITRQAVHHRIRTGDVRVVAHEVTAGRGRIHLNAEDVDRLAKERKDQG
jgi:predicted site-specific integrase-resolvase